MNIDLEKLQKENAALRAANDTLKINNDLLKGENVWLGKMLDEYRKAKYKSKSEEFIEQSPLFNEAEAAASDAAKLEEEIKVKEHTKRKGGRKPIPERYPRTRKEYDLSDSEKTCDCGHQMKKIGEEISEKIEIIPAKVEVIQHARFKYGCTACKSKIKIAKGPIHPIPKSFASPSFLANIATSKYVDGLPLHRQEAILKRMDLEIKRGTLARWMIELGKMLQPLVNLIIEHILSSKVVNADETKVQVLKEKGRAAKLLSYMWVMVRANDDRPAVYFEYAPSRSAKVIAKILQDYQGYLVTDDYEAYNSFMQTNPHKHCACWDHARRYFFKAYEAADKSEDSFAAYALNLIRALYLVERKYKDKGKKQLFIARNLYSFSILASLRTWMDRIYSTVPPKSPLGKGLHYASENWSKLNRYLEDPDIPISNERAENAIRPFVIGRKAWLFSDTPAGADASANIYSLVESTKVSGLDPFDYLGIVIAQLPYCSTVEHYERLLPWNLSSGSPMLASNLVNNAKRLQ